MFEPDCGVYVFTYAVPTFATKLAGTVAVMVTVSTKVEVSFCPFHSTTVLVWKPFEPEAMIVSVKAGPPKTTPVGERVKIDAPVGYCMEVL